MTDFIRLEALEDHPTLTPGIAATHDGKTGLIEAIWSDGQGNVLVSVQGPGFDPDEVIPEGDITLGGTPDLYPPTLASAQLNTFGYEVKNLTAPDGQVPTGWAVMIKPDNLYVAWGLPDKGVAETFALGFQTGMQHFGSQM